MGHEGISKKIKGFMYCVEVKAKALKTIIHHFYGCVMIEKLYSVAFIVNYVFQVVAVEKILTSKKKTVLLIVGVKLELTKSTISHVSNELVHVFFDRF
jgi:hypothetical protein